MTKSQLEVVKAAFYLLMTVLGVVMGLVAVLGGGG